MKSINKSDFNNQKLFNALYIIESFLFLLLCFFIVPRSDDLIFGFNEFFQKTDIYSTLHSAVYYGNGRFLGNLFCILFTRIPKIFYFVEFILVQIFCFVCEKVIEVKNTRIFILTLFLLQPIFMVKQIEAWICGFINYFIPILLLLFIFLIIKKSPDGLTLSKRIMRAVGIVVLGISEQLFIEHNAVVNLLIAITLLAVFAYKKKNVLEPVLLVLSNTVGCLLLFGYRLYIDYEQTWIYKYSPNFNRTILSLSGLSEIIKTVAGSLGTFIYFYFACIVIYTILLAVILAADKKDKSIKYKKPISFLLFLYYPAAAMVLVLYVFDSLDKMKFALIILILFVLNFMAFAYSFIKAVLLKLPVQLKWITIICFVYGAAAYVPFILNGGTSAYRGCWFAYILIGLDTLLLVNHIRKEYELKFEKYLVIFSICACIVTASYIPVYAIQRDIYNYIAENYKTEYYLPESQIGLMPADAEWRLAEGNIDHEFIPYKEFKEMQKNNQLK